MSTHLFSSWQIMSQLPSQVSISTGDIHIDGAAIVVLVLLLCTIRTK